MRKREDSAGQSVSGFQERILMSKLLSLLSLRGCAGVLVVVGGALVGAGAYLLSSWGTMGGGGRTTSVLLVVAGGLVLLPVLIAAAGWVGFKIVTRFLLKAPRGKTINVPPLPLLTGDGLFWTGRITLASWAGYQSRGGGYASRDREEPSDGQVKLSVEAPSAGRLGASLPVAEQIAAYEYLHDHEAHVTEVAVKAILEEHPKWRERWKIKEDDPAMPSIKTVEELRNAIGLGTVHILNVAKEGVAYLGLECGCEWDQEHGLGVLLLRDRVLEVCQANTSFNEVKAILDGGTKLRRKRR